MTLWGWLVNLKYLNLGFLLIIEQPAATYVHLHDMTLPSPPFLHFQITILMCPEANCDQHSKTLFPFLQQSLFLILPAGPHYFWSMPTRQNPLLLHHSQIASNDNDPSAGCAAHYVIHYSTRYIWFPFFVGSTMKHMSWPEIDMINWK